MAGEDVVERWALVEVMGHRSHYGRISEAAIAGQPLLRVEVPIVGGGFKVHDYGPSAIFGIEYLAEQEAREGAARRQGRFTQLQLGAGVEDAHVEPERRCRACGCSEFDPCEGGCGWYDDDLCTRCADDERETLDNCEHCGAPIYEDEGFITTADDCALHEACAREAFADDVEDLVEHDDQVEASAVREFEAEQAAEASPPDEDLAGAAGDDDLEEGRGR